MNNLVYLLKGEDLITYIDSTTRKSIPYTYIEEKGQVIKERFNPTIDYLKIVDKEYLKEN